MMENPSTRWEPSLGSQWVIDWPRGIVENYISDNAKNFFPNYSIQLTILQDFSTFVTLKILYLLTFPPHNIFCSFIVAGYLVQVLQLDGGL